MGAAERSNKGSGERVENESSAAGAPGATLVSRWGLPRPHAHAPPRQRLCCARFRGFAPCLYTFVAPHLVARRLRRIGPRQDLARHHARDADEAHNRHLVEQRRHGHAHRARHGRARRLPAGGAQRQELLHTVGAWRTTCGRGVRRREGGVCVCSGNAQGSGVVPAWWHCLRAWHMQNHTGKSVRERCAPRVCGHLAPSHGRPHRRRAPQ
jgi:hypothetical protein